MASSAPDVVKANEVKAVAMQDGDLTVEEAEVMTEILMELGEDKVDEEAVAEVSKLAKEASESVSPELVQTLGTLMDPLTAPVDMKELKVLKEMTDDIKRDPSMTTLNKVSNVLRQEGSDLTMQDREYAIEPSMNCKESSNALTWLQPNILEVKGPPSTEFFGRVSSGLPKLSPSNTGGGSRKDPSMLRHLRFQQRPKRKRNTNPPHRLTYGGKFKQTITKHQSKDTSSEEES